MSKLTRRKFITDIGLSTLAVPVLSSFSNCTDSPSEEKSKTYIMNQKKMASLALPWLDLEVMPADS